MKKTTIATLLLLTVFTAFAQEKGQETPKKNEVKINSFSAIVFKTLDASYEYLANDESAFGVSLLVNLNEDTYYSDGPYYYEQFAITPYYRHFFSRKYAEGFFVEGFGMLNQQEDIYYMHSNYDIDSETSKTEESTNFALGLSVGGKFISKRGVAFEFYGGVGRNILTNNNEYNLEFVPRAGVSFGYRF